MSTRRSTRAPARLDYESHATALDRNEPGALQVAAGLGPLGEHALICLLGADSQVISTSGNAGEEG